MNYKSLEKFKNITLYYKLLFSSEFSSIRYLKLNMTSYAICFLNDQICTNNISNLHFRFNYNC